MSRPGLTAAQRHILFGAVRKAAAELDEADSEAYRKRVMSEELGVEHLCDVSRSWGFDRLMARICRDAGDYDRAIKYELSATDRYRVLIVAAAEKIAPGNTLEYVAGVMIQSRTVQGERPSGLAASLATPSGWLGLDQAQLRRLLAMLKTHLRRKS